MHANSNRETVLRCRGLPTSPFTEVTVQERTIILHILGEGTSISDHTGMRARFGWYINKFKHKIKENCFQSMQKEEDEIYAFY